jgi:hypothetical protein
LQADVAGEGAYVDRLGVLSSVRHVVANAEQVHISQEKLEAVARNVAAGGVVVPAWNREWHWAGDPEETAMYTFVLDSLNFCFWGEPRWSVSYHGQQLNGYWALAASLRRAVEEGVPILIPSYLAAMPLHDLAHVLRGTTPIPLLEERLGNVQELGAVLTARYDGRVALLIAAAGGDVVALVRRVTRELSSFKDVAHYRGRLVRLYKRAQILVGDLAASLGGKGLGRFSNLDELTVFADYRLPQILRWWGVLEYEAGLAGRVDARELIAAGSAEEIEIRAHTVWAVELMRRELARLGRVYASYQLDWWLWESSQHMEGEAKPYHRTLTIYY